MIFVTVGTQLHFDRLVKMVDTWAGRHPEEDVFIQTGKTAYTIKNCRASCFIDHDEWQCCFEQADRVISHAGVGTILKSLAYAKPLIVMARHAALGEHRNDHQRATAARFTSFANIRFVENQQELWEALDSPLWLHESTTSPNRNLEALISELTVFLRGGP
ncbi:MAG: glycosyltransferase [Marinobacter sp.]